MPRYTTGSVYRTATGYGIRWPENGSRPPPRRVQDQDRGAALVRRERRPEARRGAPSPEMTFAAFCRPVPGAPWGHRRRRTADPQRAARATTGRSATGPRAIWRAPRRIAALARRAPEGVALPAHRGAPAGLAAGVRWGYMGNPAGEAGRNRQPAPRRCSVHARGDRRLAVELAPAFRPLSCSPPRRG